MRDKLGVTKYWEYIFRVIFVTACVIFVTETASYLSDAQIVVLCISWVIMIIWNHSLCIGSAGVTKLTEKGFLYIDDDEFRDLVKTEYFPEVPEKYDFEVRIIANNMLEVMKRTTEKDFNMFVQNLKYRKRVAYNEVICKVSDDVKSLESIKKVYRQVQNKEGSLATALDRLALASELMSSVALDMNDAAPEDITNILTTKLYTNIGAYNGGESSLGRLARTLSGFYTNVEFLLNDTPFDAEIIKLERMQENLLSEKKKFESDEIDYESPLYRDYMSRISKWVRENVDYKAPTIWSDLGGDK